MTRYVIDSTTLFDDETFELSPTADPACAVLLGAAASRCLSALLEAQGTIVTKKALLYQGWERYGQQVSGNSVNQAVAQVRRCLANLGQSSEWLVTVPRIGYKVADGLAIDKESAEHAQRLIIAPSVDGAPPIAPPAAPTEVEADAAIFVEDARRLRRLWPHARLPAYVCAFLGLNAALALGWDARRGLSPLASEVSAPYVAAGSDAQQQFFVGATLAGKPDTIAQHIARLQRQPPSTVSLAERPYVYINGTLRSDVYSYFLCVAPIERARAHCLSYLIVDERS
ncbi:winged helix-turn-helix domain-containing protein [Pseudomonas sp. RIT-PI-S]|uniref:winged helix-turn-helix domain-containing protein n=1 Tax=Pseudomonas sp. RIT-PI-S TaxID=3035295 RepID=UPI0021D9BF3C|nr:winged helix-turn-helix domain-containing protein [Pseudomonas sp. RIT-PI-S]